MAFWSRRCWSRARAWRRAGVSGRVVGARWPLLHLTIRHPVRQTIRRRSRVRRVSPRRKWYQTAATTMIQHSTRHLSTRFAAMWKTCLIVTMKKGKWAMAASLVSQRSPSRWTGARSSSDRQVGVVWPSETASRRDLFDHPWFQQAPRPSNQRLLEWWDAGTIAIAETRSQWWWWRRRPRIQLHINSISLSSRIPPNWRSTTARTGVSRGVDVAPIRPIMALQESPQAGKRYAGIARQTLCNWTIQLPSEAMRLAMSAQELSCFEWQQARTARLIDVLDL